MKIFSNPVIRLSHHYHRARGLFFWIFCFFKGLRFPISNVTYPFPKILSSTVESLSIPKTGPPTNLISQGFINRHSTSSTLVTVQFFHRFIHALITSVSYVPGKIPDSLVAHRMSLHDEFLFLRGEQNWNIKMVNDAITEKIKRSFCGRRLTYQ